MSDNDIKPVAWQWQDEIGRWNPVQYEKAMQRGSNGYKVRALFDQSTIDALNNQISELKTMLSIAEFQRKEMQEERDAAVADAERLRRVIHYALAQHYYGGHPRQNHWAAHAQSELAAIDAARSHDDSPMARMAAALREKAAVERSQYDKRVQSGEWGPMPELGVEAVFCVACDGAGWDGDSRERTCQSCAGSGLAARSEGGV